MALETQRTLPQLKAECEQKGIEVVIKGKKEHKEDYIRALRNYWLCKYYGSPDNAPWTLKFMLNEIECPMLCKRFKQCKPEVQKKLIESDEYIAEEKIDGCLTYNTPILLSDGTTRPIGEIVDNKLSVEVMSYDESTHSLVPRKVINWFNHGTKHSSQWIHKIHVHDASYHAYNSNGYFTRNHVFFKVRNEWDEDFCGEWRMLDTCLDPTQNQCLVRVYKREDWEKNKTSDKNNFYIKDVGNGYILVKIALCGLSSFVSNNLNKVVTNKGAVAYDIEVEGNHNFVADGFLVHNSRSLILFDSSTQSFDFYSRNNSVKDFLPQSYKDTILVTSKDFKYPDNFVLDCEVISTNPNLSTVMGNKGVVCATQLQATTALLALNPLESKSLQRLYPLKFIIFDCIYDGESLINKPWKERHPHAEKLATLLKESGFTCDINPVVRKNKLEFYSDLVEQSKEGIVLKNINAPYHGCTSRTDDQVKLKRTVSDGLNKDLDAWVTGFIPASHDKAWSNYIGALVFSCKVQMNDGTIKDHIIGVCSGIPLELRKAATIYIEGKPTLNPEFYGKVCTLSGQNVSARKLALTHAVIQCWRPDKDPSGCEILTEEELRSLVF